MNFLLHTVSSIVLLLWGIRMVRTGITRAYGDGLRQAIASNVNNRLKAVGLGMVATMLLQSSLATAIIITSFASRGLIETTSGLAVMLGADIGATLIAQALSFDNQWLSPTAIIAGFTLFAMSKSLRLQQLGRAIIGLGLMFLALNLIVTAALPLRDSDTLRTILHALGDEHVVAILFAAVLSWLAHSTLAIVLLIMSMAASGVLPLVLAVALVIGANLGGTIPPIVASLGEGDIGRRIPVGNALFKIIVGAGILSFVPEAVELLKTVEAHAGRVVVNFHAAFNIVVALIFVPLVGPAGQLLERVFTNDESRDANDAQPRNLDPTSLDSPPISLANAARETFRIGEFVENMLRDAFDALHTGDRAVIEDVIACDDKVDHLQEAVKMYVIQISQGELEVAESRRAAQIQAFSTDLEHIGDICENLANLAKKKSELGASFSKEGIAELKEMHAHVLQNFQLSMGVFLSEKESLATDLIARNRDLGEFEQRSSANHIRRLAEGQPETRSSSAFHLDAIRDMSRIRSHITSIAHLILDASKETAKP